MKYFLSIFLIISLLFISIFGISCIYGYIYPLKYTEEISIASKNFNVDSALIASVIHSESSFNKNAISKKGAVGLMQLLPSTAEYLAEKLNYREFDLTTPKDNIYLGTYYLSELLNKFQNEKLALCAFNAGPANVERWLTLYSSDNITLDEIPFKETKNYILKCERAKKYYNTKRNYFN